MKLDFWPMVGYLVTCLVHSSSIIHKRFLNKSWSVTYIYGGGRLFRVVRVSCLAGGIHMYPRWLDETRPPRLARTRGRTLDLTRQSQHSKQLCVRRMIIRSFARIYVYVNK